MKLNCPQLQILINSLMEGYIDDYDGFDQVQLSERIHIFKELTTEYEAQQEAEQPKPEKSDDDG